jgi:hypothetical protein
LSSVGAHRREEGSALVIALVFVLTMGLVITALLSQTHASFRTTKVVRSNADKVYAADAGLEQAIETLRLDRTVCAEPGDDELLPTVVVNGHSVERRCRTMSGMSSGAGGYAAVLTGTGASLITTGPGDKNLYGSAFAANLGTPDITINNGSVFEQQGVGCTTDGDKPAQLVFAPPVPLFGYHCTPTTAASVAASVDHALPAAPPSVLNPPLNTTSFPGCRVYSPGTYTNPVSLSGATYFKTGTYYFRDAIVTFGGTVIGGKRNDAEDRLVSVPPACEPAMSADAGQGTGVKWILGGTSRLLNDANIELFARLDGPANEGQMGISIQAASADNGFVNSTPSGRLVNICCGEGPTITFHGSLYAPNADVFLRVVNRQKAVFQAGIVARTLELVSPESSPAGPYVSVETSSVTRSLVVTSTAAGIDGAKDITATAVLELDNNEARTFKVVSWRVE